MRLMKLFSLLVCGALGVAATTTFAGCGDGGTGATAGAAGTSAGAAGTSAGTSGAAGTASAAECAPSCDANKGVDSECIAIVDNKGKPTYGLRMAQLSINKPTALTNIAIAALLDDGVTMNLEDCNLGGTGTFSWILQFDTANGKLTTGGAKPVDDPTAGYCFVDEMLGMPAKQVSPITVDVTPDASGKFSVEVGGDVIVPIFITGGQPVLLPLRNAKIINGTVSADQNCIGKYNAEDLLAKNNCDPAGDVTRFTDAASVDAFITLEDADTVPIESLGGQTLCVLLTGENDGAKPPKCKRDAGKITSKGDWCSTTDKAADAGCSDAFKLGADFAASAVAISGNCK